MIAIYKEKKDRQVNQQRGFEKDNRVLVVDEKDAKVGDVIHETPQLKYDVKRNNRGY